MNLVRKHSRTVLEIKRKLCGKKHNYELEFWKVALQTPRQVMVARWVAPPDNVFGMEPYSYSWGVWWKQHDIDAKNSNDANSADDKNDGSDNICSANDSHARNDTMGQGEACRLRLLDETPRHMDTSTHTHTHTHTHKHRHLLNHLGAYRLHSKKGQLKSYRLDVLDDVHISRDSVSYRDLLLDAWILREKKGNGQGGGKSSREGTRSGEDGDSDSAGVDDREDNKYDTVDDDDLDDHGATTTAHAEKADADNVNNNNTEEVSDSDSSDIADWQLVFEDEDEVEEAIAQGALSYEQREIISACRQLLSCEEGRRMVMREIDVAIDAAIAENE